MPDGYEVDRAGILKESDGNYLALHVVYMNRNKEVIIIHEERFKPNSSGFKMTISEDAGTIRDVEINGDKAMIIISYPDGDTRLELLHNHIKKTIYGKISEEQILSVATSMKVNEM